MDTTAIGLFSSDGFFQSLDNLTVASLEYVSKSREELELLLAEKLEAEEYEDCALIRDEIVKRN
jgi:hypothetical protein